jgi:hypothetical protein
LESQPSGDGDDIIGFEIEIKTVQAARREQQPFFCAG